jgi:pyridoxal phosphate enzyme (YggS family)
VCLIAVSKTVPRERALAVLEAGVGDLGENRVQEADEKWGGPGPPPARLHMVGRLQRNKARRAVELFGAIHSCDSHRLAERLSLVGEGRRVPVLLEVNVGGEASKAGFTAAELRGAFEALVALPNLRLLGLMTVAPATRDPEDARGCFVSLRRLGEELRRLSPSLGAELSMGMTDDFEVAIEEGATMVRVGRAIYGARPPA